MKEKLKKLLSKITKTEKKIIKLCITQHNLETSSPIWTGKEVKAIKYKIFKLELKLHKLKDKLHRKYPQ